MDGLTRERLAASKRGERNPNWRGDDVQYSGLHSWLNRNLTKTGVCQKCGASGKTDWANVSGDYRREASDFVELCRSCHMESDGRAEFLRSARKPRSDRCKLGHLIAGDNAAPKGTRSDGTPKLECRKCKNRLWREAHARRREREWTV